QFKAEDRDKRCLIPGEDGKLIRCPDSNKCSECKYYHTRENYGTVTFSDLATEDEEGKITEFDPPAPENYDSGDRYMRLLTGFISFAAERNPQFKEIIELLVEGNSRRQVAELMGLPKSTVIDKVAKLRKLCDEFLENQI
ncbi:MAG: hypothetical protein PUB87_06855, partial [Eubacteriaceae bacterium]|nr:hypothetical protein [Eubacteriaceae bacterium]